MDLFAQSSSHLYVAHTHKTHLYETKNALIAKVTKNILFLVRSVFSINLYLVSSKTTPYL